MTEYFWIYLVLINCVALVAFAADKLKAMRMKRRVSEMNLHILEFLGGVFSVIVLMYLIRHKNRKKSYFLYSWLALIVWIAILYFYFANLKI